MKKKILLSIILIVLVIFTNAAYATEDANIMPISEQEESVSIKNDFEIIENTHVMSEEHSTLHDTIVNGNLFGFGTNVSLNNVVIYGDMFICGQNVTFSNVIVYGTAFLAGETINMNNSNFAGNIFNASQTMNFHGTAQDIFAAGETLTINSGSQIARELFAASNVLNIEGGSIGANANISAETLTVGPTANIVGNLNYSSSTEADISSDSIIGSVNFNKTEITEDVNKESGVVNNKIYNAITLMIKCIFVCGFVFLYARKFVEKQKVEKVVGYFGINILKGFGWLILIPVIAFMLLITGFAVGLSFAVIALYSIILWASVPIVAIAVTANITKNQPDNAWKTYGCSLLVSIVFILLKQISVIGGIVTFILALASMGIIMSSLKNKKTKLENTEAEIIK